jgi:hypothetical protein
MKRGSNFHSPKWFNCSPGFVDAQIGDLVTAVLSGEKAGLTPRRNTSAFAALERGVKKQCNNTFNGE